MTRYSIKELEKLTGILAHTIRIWEKRYRIVNPNRTKSNIRYYSDEDLKRLLNCAFLTRRGYKISKIAELNNVDIEKEIEQLTETPVDTEAWLTRFSNATISLNDKELETLYQQATQRFDFETIATGIFYPLLEQIGLMWQLNKIMPAHEHLVAHFIRNKIIAATEAIDSIADGVKTFLLFLPEGEYHEIGLLYANYLLRKNNCRVIYFGQSVPFKDLISIEKNYPNAHFLSFFTQKNTVLSPRDFITAFQDQFPGKTLYILGQATSDIDVKPPINVLPGLAALKTIL